MSLINYHGDSKIIKRICALLNVKDVQDGQGHSLVDQNGIAIVSGGGGGSSTLAGLSDVDTTGVTAGDALCYNGTSQKWEDKTLAAVATSGAYSDLSGKPTKLSDFNNDEGFIDNTVNNLTNYYKKTETYTQAEVDALISAIVTIDIEVVSTLPTTDISTTTIYLVPKTTAGTDNVYDEYINTDGTSAGWELIGDTTVDLSNYYTKSEVDALIPDDLADLNDDTTHRLVTDTEKSAWSAKVDDNPTFSEASTRANIASGESFATILGKIKKYFTDLATVAFSGSYNDLTHQPTIPSVSANPSTTTATLTGIEIDGTNYAVQGGSANVQSDWEQTDTTADDYIKHKPTIPTVTADGAKQGVMTDGGKYRACLANYNALNWNVAHSYQGDWSSRTYETVLDNLGRLVTIVPWEDNSGSKVSKSGDTMTGRLTLTKDTAEMNFRADHTAYDGVISYQTSGNEAWLFTTKNAVTSMMFVNGEDTISNVSSSRWKSLTPGLQIKNNKVAIGKLIADGTTPTHALDVNGNVQASSFNGYTIEKSVPSNAVFTDTNNAVTQTNTTGSYNFRMLFSGTDDNTDRTEGARKSVNFLFNPASNIFYVGGSVNASRWWYTGSQALKIGASNEADYFIFLGVAGGAWYFGPDKDNKLYCASSSWRWRTVYAVNGSINTSDRRQKRDIEELDDFAKDFIMDLKPVSFKRIDGDRTHYGMVAQDVEDTMTKFGLTAMDFAGFCKDQKMEKYEEEIIEEKDDGTKEKHIEHKERAVEGEYIYGLRYEEFIAPMIKTIQLQQKEIEELKRRLDILEEG